MAYSEAQNRATKKYQKKVYDSVAIRVSKDDKVRERWKSYADKSGLSLSVFIQTAVEEKAERDGLK